MADSWSPPPWNRSTEQKTKSNQPENSLDNKLLQQEQVAYSVSAAKHQNSNDQSIRKTLYIPIQVGHAELLEHFGFREHLNRTIPDARVEFQPEDQKVKIILKDSATFGSEYFQKSFDEFLKSIHGDSYRNPKLCLDSMKKEQLDILQNQISESLTNCYFHFDGTEQVKIHGLSRKDIDNAKQTINDLLEKTILESKSTCHHSFPRDVTVTLKGKSQSESICKFRDEFDNYVLKELGVGAQLVGVESNHVTFHGIPERKATEIVQTFFARYLQRCRISFKESVCFLVWDEPRYFVNKMLAEKDLKCLWSVDRDDVHIEVLACSEDVVEKASKLIEKSVVHHSIPVPDEATRKMVRELLKSDFLDSVWYEDINSNSLSAYRIGTTENILNFFLEKLNEKNRKERNFQTSYFCKVDVQMSHESKKHLQQMQQDDVTDIESKCKVKISSSQSGWEVKGHSDQRVQKAADDLTSLGNKLLKADIISASQKAKSLFEDNSFLQQLQEKHGFCTIHPKHGYVIEDPRGPLEKYCWFFGPQHLIQAEGKISEAHADILFCPVDYRFHPVDVGKEIVEKAGKEVKQFVQTFNVTEDKLFAKLKEGDVHFQQRTGFLKSHWIAFAVFPFNGGKMQCTDKTMKKMYQSVVQHAEEKRCRTVAMPVIFEDNKCKAFVKGIKDANKHWTSAFAESFRSNTSISELILVTKAEMETEELKKRLGKETKSGHCTDWRHVKPLSEDEKIMKSPIQIDSTTGSIVDPKIFQMTDMIVNSVDLRLEFNAGFVSAKLLKSLGHSVKDECKKKKPNGLSPGEVVTSAAGQYKNKIICHAGMFPEWDLLNNFSLRVLKCIVLKCLEEADKRRLQSVSFPTLGTGTLKYCHKKVAETMVGYVNHYGKQHPKTSIKLVNFIIYKEDHVIQAFLDAHTRIAEIPYRLTLEGKTNDVFDYLESADSTSDCLLRIVPKYPFEKMPLDFLFTLDADSTHSFSKNDIRSNKILNRLETCVSIQQDLQQAVTSCLNLAVGHQASSIAFAFNTAKVKKEDINTIATTFKSHRTGGHITACYILLEDMTAPGLRKPSEAGGQTGYLQRFYSSIRSWTSSEICWLSKEAMTADFFRKVHCLTLVTHMRDHLKPLTEELEGYLHRPLEWVLEEDGTKTTASQELAEKLTEGYMHPNKMGHVTFKGKSFEYDLNNMDMMPVDYSASRSTVRISVKVDPDLPEKKQMKTEPSFSDVFEDATAEVNLGLGKLLQTAGMVDQIKQIGLSTSFQNGNKMCTGKMEDMVRLDKVLRSSMERSERPPRKDSQTSYRSDSESSLVAITNIPMTNLEYLAVDFYMQKHSLWKKASPLWQNGSLCIMADTVVSDKGWKKLESEINAILKTLQSISWGELIVEDEFMAKVEDGIKEVGQSEDFRDVFYHFDEKTKTIHIFSQTYNEITKAKHKIGLAIGTVKISKRRERRFDLGPSPTSTVGQGSRDFDNSFRDTKNTGSPHFPPLDISVFHTSEGLVVKVYPGSILRLDVDCIVNAANGDLQHGGGVAYVISNAAGYDFDRESRDYIARYGPLRVGEVCTTSAGNLKYKGVIHSVGPRWYDYGQNDKWICLKDLKTAVKNSLEEADFQQYKSIAIPAISSGIFGVPKELCTQEYYRAVEEYSKSRRSHSTLTEVHFIDKDTQMCELIRTTFTKCFSTSSGMATGNSGGLGSTERFQTRNQLSASCYPSQQSNHLPLVQRSRSLSSDEGSLTNNSSSFDTPSDEGCLTNNCGGTPSDQNQARNKRLGRSISRDSKFCYQIGNNLTVHIVCGDIIEADTEAIVNSENEKFDGSGSIARAIRKVAGEKYIDEIKQRHLQTRSHEMAEVLDTLAGDSEWKFVLHVLAPRWDHNAVKDPKKYEKNLTQSYENVLISMDKLKLDTLAMPVLGTGIFKHTTPYATIAEVILSVSKHFAYRIRNRKEVYVYCTDRTLLSPIKDVFDREFSKDDLLGDDQKNPTQPGHTEHGYRSKDKQASVEVTEDCCICMDTMTEPKKLSCGHMFCRECIDQQFKYKPACPQCGAVHGKITGDQPPGTMTMTTTKSYGRGGSLPGYSGCGIINISYHFPPGKQGPDHPNQGKQYQGITRPGFLPDNEKGRLVAKLLRIAFDRKLVFTIGRSRTTGHDGVVTWNDIHHKTRLEGGPQAFGYPDPTYLDRVLDELKAKGVTEESLNDP